MTDYSNSSVYLAAPFFTQGQINCVKAVERVLTAHPNVDTFFSPMREQDNPAIEQGFEQGSREWEHETYKNDVAHIENADTIVAIVDYVPLVRNTHLPTVDPGTAFEIGYAARAGKRIILVDIGRNRDIMNLMLSVPATAIVHTADELAEVLNA